MTTITATPTTMTPAAARGLGAATAAVAGTMPFLFAHDWNEVITVVALVLVVSAGVFGYLVPRGLQRDATGGTALTLGILAALTAVPAFWSGMPLVLGVAALVLGNHGRTARHGGGRAITGLVLGALAVAFYLTVHVHEGIAGHTGFLLG